MGGRSRAVSRLKGFDRLVKRVEMGGRGMLGWLEFFAGGIEGIVECVDLGPSRQQRWLHNSIKFVGEATDATVIAGNFSKGEKPLAGVLDALGNWNEILSEDLPQ
jgi:hypothetical protein